MYLYKKLSAIAKNIKGGDVLLFMCNDSIQVFFFTYVRILFTSTSCNKNVILTYSLKVVITENN